MAFKKLSENTTVTGSSDISKDFLTFVRNTTGSVFTNVKITITNFVNLLKSYFFPVLSSSTADGIAVFDGVTGKLIKDSQITISNISSLSFFDATVGDGGDYMTVEEAQNDGKFILNQVGDIAENPTGSVLLLDDRMRLYNSNQSYTWTFADNTRLIPNTKSKIYDANIIGKFTSISNFGIITNQYSGANFYNCTITNNSTSAMGMCVGGENLNGVVNFRECTLNFANVNNGALGYSAQKDYSNYYNCTFQGGGSNVTICSTYGYIESCTFSATVSSSAIIEFGIINGLTVTTTNNHYLRVIFSAKGIKCTAYQTFRMYSYSDISTPNNFSKVEDSVFPNAFSYATQLRADNVTFLNAVSFDFYEPNNANNVIRACTFKGTLTVGGAAGGSYNVISDSKMLSTTTIANSNNTVNGEFRDNVTITSLGDSTKLTGQLASGKTLTLNAGVENCDIHIGVSTADNADGTNNSIINNSGNLTNRITTYKLA